MKKEWKNILKEKGRTALPKVLLAASECAPLSKTGGLADVVGTLPKTLQKLGLDARVITPYHRCIKEKYGSQVEHLFYIFVDLGWRHQYAGIERLVLDGVTIYLVDSEYYFGDKIYRGGEAEGEQYAFFTRAVLDCLSCLDFQPDVIHCNDWHTAMLPMLAKTQYNGRMQGEIKFLLTIHNIAFQGKFAFPYVQDLLGVDSRYYTSEFMELYGCANFLKGGCVFADRINTVSPSYAREILDPYYGEGLQGILSARQHELSGIINGIDKESFKPHGDPLLPAGYDRGHLGGKAQCKKTLQENMGLEVRDDVPLFAMVTRMTEQKGFPLVMEILDDVMQNSSMQFMLLGSGDAAFEDFMRQAQARYPGRLCAYIGYQEALSHLVYAGSDFFVMPSRFEPCGLSQMIAMRYGSIPIVRETGGLKDTVEHYNAEEQTGTGLRFYAYNSWELKERIYEATRIYEDKDAMKGLISRAMQADFGFERSAQEYAKLYLCML